MPGAVTPEQSHGHVCTHGPHGAIAESAADQDSVHGDGATAQADGEAANTPGHSGDSFEGWTAVQQAHADDDADCGICQGSISAARTGPAPSEPLPPMGTLSPPAPPKQDVFYYQVWCGASAFSFLSETPVMLAV